MTDPPWDNSRELDSQFETQRLEEEGERQLTESEEEGPMEEDGPWTDGWEERFGFSQEERDAVQWFIGKRPSPPKNSDGSIDFECLCGEFLIEGADFEEVKRNYYNLPINLRRKD